MKETNKKLSLIIPCYNSAKYLPDCFDSLRSQSRGLDDVEVILVDDASTDDGKSVSMLYDFQKEYPGTKVICHEKNKRQGGSRNTGVANATGEYVGFLDADDYLDENYLDILLPILDENHPDVLQFGHYEFLGDKNAGTVNIKETVYNPEITVVNSTEERITFVLGSQMSQGNWDKLYRREMLVESGVKFRENGFYEEPLFTYPLRFYVNKFQAIEDCPYNYRVHGESALWQEMYQFKSIKDHMGQCLELFDYMKKSKFYQDFSQEIDFKFIHSYLLETFLFCGKRKFSMDLSTYENMRKNFMNRMGENPQNKYISPGSFYNTLIDMVKRNNMNQGTLDEIVSIFADY